MQKAENVNNFSGSTEQNLPGDTAMNGADDGKIHPADFKLQHDKPEVSAVSASALSASTSTETTAAVGAEWPAPARSMERTHEMMSLQAVRLRESGQDSLQVVIRPDTGLQLSLHLQMRDGNVEMRALLHRGNFEFLNVHWPELQQQLESRGVRLGPLEYSDAAADGQGGSQSADQQTPDDSANASGAFAEFALNSTLVPKPAAGSRSTRARGWESWA
jgi:hypothetical protein